MPSAAQKQKKYEKFLIREFLAAIGYKISSPKWQESPDCLLMLSNGSRKTRVAIEHTDYFHDTVAGSPSPLTPVDEFWKTVQHSIVRRISHRKRLTGISARVWLNINSLPKHNNEYADIARQLAKALIDFVETHPVRKGEHRNFHHNNFQEHPYLNSLLDSILLSRWTNDTVFASQYFWTCSNIATGNIGLNLGYIKTAIKNKNEKAKKYNWADATDKWLMIAASGRIVSNRAGPPQQDVNWTDAELTNLCQNSLFDRIVFWERVRSWYKWLKPNCEIMQYGNDCKT